MPSRRPDATALAVLLTVTGVLHLVAPAPFDAIVPRSLPGGPRFWTLASGVAELGVAAAVAVAVAMAVSSGAEGLEAAALAGAGQPAVDDLAVLGDLPGTDVVLWLVDPRGAVRERRDVRAAR